MKKFLLLGLGILLILSIVGCSNSNEMEGQIDALGSRIEELETQVQEIVNYLYAVQTVDNQENINYYEDNEESTTLFMSFETYSSIELGSSYEDIVSLVSDYGILVAEVNINDESIKTFRWDTDTWGEATGVFFKFSNDKLTEKWTTNDNYQTTTETEDEKDYYNDYYMAETLEVSKSTFNKIEIGSSYESVYTLIGDYGILESEIGANPVIQTYKWSVMSTVHYIHCRFEDGILVEKWADPYSW